METTKVYWGYMGCTGKENGNYYDDPKPWSPSSAFWGLLIKAGFRV